jgi:hypothetical protein
MLELDEGEKREISQALALSNIQLGSIISINEN